ncbi:unnamed protein product [Paramecium pentaurelia]|uniref:Uncharacterized protein n=1 Tax=Paramecium pentaurelia TaxID=43138 RepID=A0A8S1Y0X0_9CILI|nr:unnamed protein product [Paramecium pentaurelia]
MNWNSRQRLLSFTLCIKLEYKEDQLNIIRMSYFTLKKYLQFIDNNGVDHIYEMPIQDRVYEIVWYFIGFEMQLIQTHSIQIEFPFYDEKLKLIFGGDLSVKHNQQLHNSQNEKLSYFLGQVLILNYYQISSQHYCNTVISFILSSNIDGCRCVPSQNTKINDQVIQKQEEFLFISSKQIANNFYYHIGQKLMIYTLLQTNLIINQQN